MADPSHQNSGRTLLLLTTLLAGLCLAGFLCWVQLKKGIDFRHLSFSSADITDLSLRLDRGLIIGIGRLTITPANLQGNGTDFEEQIPRIKKWGHLVQEITIQRLEYQDQAAGITYRDGLFQIRSDRFAMEAALAYARGTFHLDLTRLEIKPYRLILIGQASYARPEDQFRFSGTFSSPLGNGSLKISEHDNQVAAELSTDEFSDLAGILEQFPLDPDITAWVADNIAAGSYRIKELLLRFKLGELHNIGPDNISGTAVAEGATVRFHQDLPPIRCDRVNITFADDRLTFDLDRPSYKNKDLAGSSVYIDHIIQPRSRLGIRILTETPKDDDIVEILEKYDISFNALQETGTTTADLQLTFDLPEFTLTTKGTFTAGPGRWNLWGIPVNSDGAVVDLVNDTITFRQAHLAYRDIVSGLVSGSINITAHHSNLQAEIDSLHYRIGSNEILRAAGLSIPFEIDHSAGSFHVWSEELAASLRIADQLKEITLDSLENVAPLMPVLQKIPFSEGNARISLRDMSDIRFSGQIDLPNTLLSRDGQPVTLFQFHGAGNRERTEVSVNNGLITIMITDQAEVTLDEYLVTIDTDRVTGGESPSVPYPLVITGPASLLKVQEFNFPTGPFKFDAQGTDLSFAAEMEKGHFLFESTSEGKTFVGKDLDAAIVDPFFKNTDMSEGTLNISLKGIPDNIEGYMELHNIVIRSTKLLNNILAFLNAIPALATFSTPGFDQDGYRVDEGVMLFSWRDNVLTINEMSTNGVTINTETTGWIDNRNRTLQLNMELITLKDYSKIIGMIPLAGYAILGENGSLSTSLEVTGSIDDPTIQTNLASEILISPLNIIKRTVEWPFTLFDKVENRSERFRSRNPPAPKITLP